MMQVDALIHVGNQINEALMDKTHRVSIL